MLRCSSLLCTLACAFVCATGAAAQEGAPEQERSVLVMDLTVGASITKDEAAVVTQEIATELSKVPLVRVQTVEDSRVTLGVEAQKQMLGCDDNSCLAEIAQAMGTETLLFGRLDRIGAQLTLQVTLLESSNAQPLVRSSGRADSLTRLLEQVPLLLVDAKKELNPFWEPQPSASPSSSLSPLLVAGLSAAGLGVVTTAVGAGGSLYAFAQMSNGAVPKADREFHRSFVFWPAVVAVGAGLTLVAAGGAVAMVGVAE